MASELEILPARFPRDREALKALLCEYEQSLGIDLHFQSFDEEVASLPGKYAPPKGNILLAQENGQLAGSVCWYPFASDTAEIKRLYVRPAWRGKNIGKTLLARAIDEIRHTGYRRICLDSMERLAEAARLYESFGFRRIAPYNVNPHEDVYYMALELAPETQAA